MTAMLSCFNGVCWLISFVEGAQNGDIERNESLLIRKKMNILHGLHRVGESLKMRKGFLHLFSSFDLLMQESVLSV